MSTTTNQESRDRVLTLEVEAGGRTFDFSNQKLQMSPKEDPEIIKGYWKKDKAGKEFIKKAVLGDTVYFHFATRGLNGREVSLKLYDRDFYMGLDWMDPDDKKFPVKEIIKSARVNNNRGFVELFLDESWEGLIADDKNFLGFSNERIELYWELTYNNKYKTRLPKSTEHYLLVGQNDRSLYIKPFSNGHNMPEFFDYDGNPLAHFQLNQNKNIVPELEDEVKNQKAVLNQIGSIIKDQAIEYGPKYINKKMSSIALARFERATFTAKKTPYSPNILNDIYTQDPKIIKQLKHHDFKKVIKDNGVKSLEFYGESGTKMKVLGFMKKTGSEAGTAFDLFDLFKFATSDGLDFNNPLSFPGVGALGPIGAAFSLLNGVAGLMVKQIKDDQDALLSADMQRQVDKAKLKGLDATKAEVGSWYTSLNKWSFKPISKKSANLLLTGKFQKMDELLEFDYELYDENKDVTLLYRSVENKNKGHIIEIIETIFFEV
ncbi:hypothetical protein [Maribacter luteus]|uniref:hypothetical protein n=1 Tax=Maribacter luteus TaxID=2594478 RepID=UPI0024930115|nr:hypothetical protein [Maribacter luteus]